MSDEPQKDWLDEAIQLEATPKHLRKEKTRTFCKRHNIPESTYYSIISRKENKARVLEMALNKAKDAVPEVLEVLVDKAKGGDIRAIDTYLETVVQLAKQLDIKSDGKPIVFIPAEIAKKNDIETSAPDA